MLISGPYLKLTQRERERTRPVGTSGYRTEAVPHATQVVNDLLRNKRLGRA
jgi:hypothetical protein